MMIKCKYVLQYWNYHPPCWMDEFISEHKRTINGKINKNVQIAYNLLEMSCNPQSTTKYRILERTKKDKVIRNFEVYGGEVTEITDFKKWNKEMKSDKRDMEWKEEMEKWKNLKIIKKGMENGYGGDIEKINADIQKCSYRIDKL